MVSSGYHIVTGIALLFWSAIGQPSPVSFVRAFNFLNIQNDYDSNLSPIVALHPLCIHFCRRTFLATLCFPRTSVTCLSFDRAIPRLNLYSKLSCFIPQHAPTVLFLDPPNYISSPHSVPTHPLPSPSLHVPQHSSQQSCPIFHIPLRWLPSYRTTTCRQSALGTHIRNPRCC